MKPLIQKHEWDENIGLYLAMRNGDTRSIATKVTFEEMKPAQCLPAAPITFSLLEAQELADQLFAAGIRPSAAAGSAGQLDAVKYHLEDLRTLVFKGKKT